MGYSRKAIAKEVLAAELLYREAQYDAAYAHLREGISLSDALPYDEPAGWLMSVRQTLGALLVEQGIVPVTCFIHSLHVRTHVFPKDVMKKPSQSIAKTWITFLSTSGALQDLKCVMIQLILPSLLLLNLNLLLLEALQISQWVQAVLVRYRKTPSFPINYGRSGSHHD